MFMVGSCKNTEKRNEEYLDKWRLKQAQSRSEHPPIAVAPNLCSGNQECSLTIHLFLPKKFKCKVKSWIILPNKEAFSRCFCMYILMKEEKCSRALEGWETLNFELS